MIELPTYKFDEYTFRPAGEADLELAQRWNAQDKHHGWEKQYPRYWVDQNNLVNSYVLEDGRGIVFFVKSIRHAAQEIEITLQFDCRHHTVSSLRAVRAMTAGFRWLKEALPLNGFKAVYFVTRSKTLGLFAEQILGFTREPHRYVYTFERS